MEGRRDETFEATVHALEAAMADCSARDDRAGYFAAMYLAVTRTVQARAAAGRFDDPARMERFVAHFAGRYLDAYDGWRAGRPIAASWTIAFRTSRRWRPIALQHLLLGMNAHINLDLGVTAAEFAGVDGLATVRRDFDAINHVLADLVDACQSAVGTVSPWIDLADRVSGPGDEAIVRFSLVAARRQAWRAAERLAELQGADRDRAATEIDEAAARIGRCVCNPGLRGNLVLLIVRMRERARPREVIRILNEVRV
ncbi:MAG: DUF5995 family protein [Acidimicrobiia bacterium]